MRKGNIEHPMTSKKTPVELSKGVSQALDKVREFNEAEQEPELIPVSGELKELALFGKITEEIKVGNFIFKLATLTRRQQKELITKLLKMNSEERILHVKTMTLAEAIITVNNVPLSELYAGSDELTEAQKRNEVVSDLQSVLVEKLFAKYENMVAQANDFLNQGGLGDQIKN